MSPRRLAFAAILALALFHAREAVFEGRAFYVRDLHLQWYGQVESFVRTLHAGSLPLWDPWVSFGQPMLANPNTQTLYPPTWLNLLMRPWTYYAVYLVGHLVLAGLGVYAAARRLSVSPFGALVAAATFVSSGPLLSLGNLWNHLGGAAWLPWTLYATLGAMDAPSPRRAVGLGATLAAAVLAGSPDFAVLSALAAAAVVAARLARPPWDGAAARRLYAALGGLLFALGLAAAQILPSLELAERSERFRQTVEERAYWSLHPVSLLQTVVPLGWSDLALSPAWSLALHEGREPYLFSVFLGLPAVLLALCAFGRGARSEVRLLGGLAAAALLFSVGRHLPFQALAVALLPPLAVVRFPSKAMVLVACAAGLLAGLGWDRLRAAAGARARVGLAAAAALGLGVAAAVAAAAVWLAPERVAAGLTVHGLDARDALRPLLLALGLTAAAAAAGLVLVARTPGRVAAAGLALLAVLPVAWRHRALNPTAPAGLFSVRPPVLDRLDRSGAHRLFVYDYLVTPTRSRERLGRDVPYLAPGAARPAPWLAALGQRLYLLPPTGAAFGVRDSFGRDLLGLQPTPLARLNALTLLADDTPAQARLLRLGAVDRALALHDLGADLEPDARLPGPFFEDMRVFRVPSPLPRAYAVSGARRLDPGDRLLADAGFDPAREVALAGGPERPADPGFTSSVRILEDRPDRMRIATSAQSDGWLVLVDAYDPGWQARLDGRRVELLRANLAFRAIALPAGDHEAELRYRPAAVSWGVGVSLAFGLAALLLVARRA